MKFTGANLAHVALLLQLATWPAAATAATKVAAAAAAAATQEPTNQSSNKITSQLPSQTATTAARTPQQATTERSGSSSSSKDQVECQYEKSAWTECQANGEQTRTLKLISSVPATAAAAATAASGLSQQESSGARGSKCPRVKLVRRECKQGCKYIRGDWLPDCVNGQRVRIDTLVARIEPQLSGASKQQIKCEPQRKVTKDCRRACHYVKSAWSECANGFKTRDLRLEELPSSPSSCAKHRQIRRECATTKTHHEANKLRPATTTSTSTPSTTTTTTSPQQQQQQQNQQSQNQPTQKLTLAQKRRLKQLQRQQQKQQQQLANNNNNNNKSI